MDPVILASKNYDFTLNNTDILNQIPGEQSYDKIICDNDNDISNYPVEFLNSLTVSALPPHKKLHRFADQKLEYKGSISQWNKNAHQIYVS